MSKKKILFFGVLPESIMNFRFDLINLLILNGYKVDVLVSKPTESFISQLHAHNVEVHSINIERRSYNPFLLFFAVFKTFKIVKKSRPHLVISYTIKPIVISLICKAFSNKFKLILLIEGLGSIFDKGSTMKYFLKNFIVLFYKLFFSKAEAAVFLNEENRNYFINKSICNHNNAFLINGIGVDLNKFSYSEVKHDSKIIFLLISRLIKEKGIIEFLESAKSIKSKYINTEFRVIGPVENDNFILEKIHEYEAYGFIKYFGYLKDVKQQIENSSVFVLPTYYNEGMPRTILESMAIGRAIVTTNTPGCNKTVIEGFNGFFVNSRDSRHLTDILLRFVDNPSLIQQMGAKSRILAENKFSSDVVNDIFFKKIIYPLIH